MRSEGNYLRGNDDAMYFLFSRVVKFGQWYLVFCAYKSLDAADCFHLILDSHVNTSLFRSRSVWQIMSINERIKVLWKTSCEWRDKPHFPKRRDFQLREGELEGSLLPLNVGDAAKIKFGSRWYNVEVAESWSPKSRRGMCC